MTGDLPRATYAIVDARGHRCPTPTLRLRLRRALEGAPALALVVLLADDPMARIDVAHFAAICGHELVDQVQDGAVLRFTVRKAASADGADHGARPE